MWDFSLGLILRHAMNSYFLFWIILLSHWISWNQGFAQEFQLISSEVSGLNLPLEFKLDHGFHLPEIMAGGMAVADFDQDGRKDIVFCRVGQIGKSENSLPESETKSDSGCLWFRQVSNLKFEAVKVQGGQGPKHAMGAWPMDFDQDGLTDLLVTGWRGSCLLKNLGNWSFQDVTDRLDIAPPEWSTAAVWADFNGDRFVDLFVAGYVRYDPEFAPFCAAPDGNRDYCGPEDFEALKDHLYLNDGHHHFQESGGLLQPSVLKSAPALGAIAFDQNQDGRLDLFVANDGAPNRFFIQSVDGHFEESAIELGVAMQSNGEPLAGMGVAVARLEPDSEPSLFVTNFYQRGTVCFEARKSFGFIDQSASRMIQERTRTVNGFGIAVADLDGNGRLELIQANGHVLRRERLGTPFKMPISFLSQDDSGKFQKVNSLVNPLNEEPLLGRGLIVEDLDGDNRPDILISRLDGSPILLQNRSSASQIPAPHRIVKFYGGSYLSGTLPPK